VSHLDQLTSTAILERRRKTLQNRTLGRSDPVPLEVPPLRERAQDIALLVEFFVGRLCEKNNLRTKPIDDEVMRGLQRYRWPGNVCELQNVAI